MQDEFVGMLRQATGDLAVAAHDIDAMYHTARSSLHALKALAAQKGVELDVEPFLAELHDPQYSIRLWERTRTQLNALAVGIDLGSKLR